MDHSSSSNSSEVLVADIQWKLTANFETKQITGCVGLSAVVQKDGCSKLVDINVASYMWGIPGIDVCHYSHY